MMSDPVTWLGWLCYAGAAVAIVVYVIHFAGRQGWRRPWNAAGLFFTAIALSQAPSLFQAAPARVGSAAILTVCLLVATGLQAFTAMRRRKRREDAPTPETAA